MKKLLPILLILAILACAGCAGLSRSSHTSQEDAPELSERIEEFLTEHEAGALREELALLLQESADLTDAELCARLRAAAEAHGIDLSDAQLDQLVKLCRTIEKGQALKDSAAQSTQKLGELAEKAQSVLEKAAGVFQKLGGLLKR